MLERLLNLFRDGPAPSGLTREDPRVAAAALLYLAMDADGERRDEERSKLRAAMAAQFNLDGDQLSDILEAGEKAEQDAVDLFAFTSVLKREFDHDQCLQFIAMLWEVVFADGILHELEDNTVWRIADLIGVSNRDRVLLRQRAADTKGIRIGNGDHD